MVGAVAAHLAADAAALIQFLSAEDFHGIPRASLRRQAQASGDFLSHIDPDAAILIDLDFFRLARETIVRYLTNFGTLYVLESQIDLSAFTDVKVVGKTLIEFVNRPELSVNFLLWKQNMGVLQPFDAQRSFPAYSPMIPPEMEAATKFLSEKGC